jgi:hypothetical protein
MAGQIDSRFLYHAHGVGFGGQIKRPFCDVIEAQGATALPIVGGYASSHVDAYRFRDIVSVRSLRIHAVGTEGPRGSFNTSVSVRIEGLNILDVITADSLTARLSSLHEPNKPQPRITAVGSDFGDLRIGGHPIKVVVDSELFLKERTHADFKDCVQKSDPAEISRQFLWGRGADQRKAFGSIVPQGPEGWPESKGLVLCSLVKSVDAKGAGCESQGYAIHVPMVGTLYLGEVIVSEYARRLTMLRLEMGSPVEGRLEACSGEVDGATYP